MEAESEWQLTIHTPNAVKNDASACSKNTSFFIGLVRLVVSSDLHNRFLLHKDGSAVASVSNPNVITPHKARGSGASVLRTLKRVS